MIELIKSVLKSLSNFNVFSEIKFSKTKLKSYKTSRFPTLAYSKDLILDYCAKMGPKEKKKDRKMAKRKWEPKQVFDEDDHQPDSKKTDFKDSRKKKVAMMLAYSGKNYYGMQRNPGFPTIESCLLDALVKAGVVRPEQIEQPGVKMAFQRAARTDKGVSACGQVVSFKMLIDVEDAINKINSHLPDHIRVFGTKRTTKSFDCKNSCSYRTYSYLTPSFAFAPVDQIVSEDYRINKEQLEKLRHTVTLFCGTFNFHNFTSGKASSDASASRYILDFTVSEPFVRGRLEYLLLRVKGQSFMMHQIRKMIGLSMAINRGFVGVEYIKQAWKANKIDIPKAPGLGLMLERVHYDGYNNKFASDGLHDAIEWTECQQQVEEFKESHIYSEVYKSEEEEKSMLNWLVTLSIHNYGLIAGHNENRNALLDAKLIADKSVVTAAVDGGGEVVTVVGVDDEVGADGGGAAAACGNDEVGVSVATEDGEVAVDSAVGGGATDDGDVENNCESIVGKVVK